MLIFNKNKNRKNVNSDSKQHILLFQQDYETNISTENLIDIFDTYFYVVCKAVSQTNELNPSCYSLNNAIHVSMDGQMIEQLSKDAETRYGEKYAFYRVRMHVFLEDILNDTASAVIVYRESGAPYIIASQAVESISEEIRTFNVMYSTVRGQYYTKKEAYNMLKDANFVFIGTLPEVKNGVIPAETTFYLSEIDIGDGDDKHKALRCFVNEYSARKFGGDGKNLIKWPLSKIKAFYGGKVIIEPHRNWWMEF